jgi:hypothetical protein
MKLMKEWKFDTACPKLHICLESEFQTQDKDEDK